MSVSRLIGIMQEQGEKNNPPYISIGVVKSIDPFLVQINSLTLDKEDLYIPSDLLKNQIKGEIVLNGALSGNTSDKSCDCNTSHYHTLGDTSFSGNFEINTKNQFKENDLVALLPLKNKQKYLLLNKVVALS